MLTEVGPPAAPVHRVGWHQSPYDPQPWSRAKEDGTFGNRFDDPGKASGIPDEQGFRMLYYAESPNGAFGESLAMFRPSLKTLAGLRKMTGTEPDTLETEAGLITADWRKTHLLAHITLDPTLVCADISSSTSIQHLRDELASMGLDLGLNDIDYAALLSENRPLTQRIARYIYEQAATFAGIPYTSRHGKDWACWAMFSDRVQTTHGQAEPIEATHPALIAVARLFGLRIEAD